MKKIIALVLAAMMLFSAVAFASSQQESTEPTATPKPVTTFEDKGLTYTYNYDKVTTSTDPAPSVNTQVWLQVKAEGQINVKVPLVLVFSTNMEGGTSTIADAYKITNNNANNAVAIKGIKVTNDSSGQNILLKTATEFAAATDQDYNWFKVTMAPQAVDKEVKLNTADAWKTPDMGAIMASELKITDTDKYGIWLNRGQSVNMKPTMTTTAFNKVTADDPDKGVKVMTVTYTLGLVYENFTSEALPTADITMPPTPAPTTTTD